MAKRSLDGIGLRQKKELPKKQKKKSFRPNFWIFFAAAYFILYTGLISWIFYQKIELLNTFRTGRFLILLQNNSELRSSGGFIGSYAIFETQNYKIKNINFNTNIYSLDREYAQENFTQAPFPVSKMLKGETWALRDSNYDADFRDASKDITSFYEKETGENIDAIIALNAKIVIDLLKLSGPIHLDKYNLDISSDNFYEETQYNVEKAYYENPENWAINEPKTFLKDLYPELLKKSLEHPIGLSEVILSELGQKEIIFNFKNQKAQSFAEYQNLAGAISDTSSDYLYINNNSYSGNKSSTSISENIDYKIFENPQNPETYNAVLTIARTHNGSDIWPDGKNTDWLRAYVPQNAQFQNATLNGTDVTKYIDNSLDSGKRYFGMELAINPGETSILELRYSIPKEKKYELVVQKQPGQIGDKLSVNYLGKIIFSGTINRDLKISN